MTGKILTGRVEVGEEEGARFELAPTTLFDSEIKSNKRLIASRSGGAVDQCGRCAVAFLLGGGLLRAARGAECRCGRQGAT